MKRTIRNTIALGGAVLAALGHRTAAGRRGARRTSDLDHLRPQRWDPDWSDDLLWLVRALARTVELDLRHRELLDRVLEGPLMSGDELPVPSDAEQAVPPTIPRQRPGSAEF